MTNRYDNSISAYTVNASNGALTKVVAGKLAEGNVVGWFQGRMEYGPRALGSRSILGDARNPEMQKKMNLKIKYREGFRPFAPSVLEEDIREYFCLARPSPYMLLVIPVKESHLKPLPKDYHKLDLYDRLYHLRSDIPAVTHVDYSARIQTVEREGNPLLYAIDDLLFQDALLDSVERAIDQLVILSRDLFPALIVGAPLRQSGGLFNTAVVIHRGSLLGVVPKTYLPSYREFYEQRHFTSGAGICARQIVVAGHQAPFGVDLVG